MTLLGILLKYTIMPKLNRHPKLTKDQVIDLLKQTYTEWLDDNIMVISAALSYYFIFAIAPLMIIIIAVAGFFLKTEVVRAEILGKLTYYLDFGTANYILSIASSYLNPKAGIVATIIAVIIMLIGATSVFAMLKQALNTIWKKTDYSLSLKIILEERLNFLLVILGVGIWVIFSIFLSPFFALFNKNILQVISIPDFLITIGHALFSIIFSLVPFAMMFKFLPDRKILWSDVWAGSIVSAIFFTIGRYLIGFYLSASTVSSAYGAAGSLVAILLWVYYSSLIFLFGAEFTQVYAKRYGSRIKR
ncbi:MAG: YihY/virulence factor BrkB family protein [Deltaproteobacteria bacterium]|nr:YihY/virulence factor BrkB family protein [Deltaproteobacteria bacterium]